VQKPDLRLYFRGLCPTWSKSRNNGQFKEVLVACFRCWAVSKTVRQQSIHDRQLTFFLYSAIAAKLGFMRPSCSSSFVIWTPKSSSLEISSAICSAFSSGSCSTGLSGSIWFSDSLLNYKHSHTRAVIYQLARLTGIGTCRWRSGRSSPPSVRLALGLNLGLVIFKHIFAAP